MIKEVQMNHLVMQLITTYSMIYGVDPTLAAAVISHESKFNTEAVGDLGELGLMQLRPEFFSAGCKGRVGAKTAPNAVPCGKELFRPEVNIRVGIRNLARLQKACKHKSNGTYIVCHNLGVVGGGRIKDPKKFVYYTKVMAEYAKIEKQGIFKQESRLFLGISFKPGKTQSVAYEPNN
jgi:hypothetical protein